VILTLVLSVVSRSITDIAVTTSEEEALRAFSAAEAGVEQALIQDAGFTGGTPATGSVGVSQVDETAGEATFSYLVDKYPTDQILEYVYPYDLASGESGTVWLIPHGADGELDDSCGGADPCYDGNRVIVCWGRDLLGSGAIPAVEVALVYEDPGTGVVEIARRGIDPDSSRRSSNSFVGPSGAGQCGSVGLDGESFDYGATINLTTGNPASRIIKDSVNPEPGDFKFLKVRMLYNTDQPHPFAVIDSTGGGQEFPSQGRRIESTGASGVASRRVEVYALYPEPPSVFDSALFSPFAIVK
jgi:hypothetical protein